MSFSLSTPAAPRTDDLSILDCQLSTDPRNSLCYLPLTRNAQNAPKFTQCFLSLTDTHFRKYLCYLSLTKKGGGGGAPSTCNTNALATLPLSPLFPALTGSAAVNPLVSALTEKRWGGRVLYRRAPARLRSSNRRQRQWPSFTPLRCFDRMFRSRFSNALRKGWTAIEICCAL